jgi:two-component system NtrC family sensor kinase
VNFRFIHHLQFKVALGFLFVSLVPLGIVSSFSVRTADTVIESIVTNQLENVASDKQQLLQRWLVERQADVEVVAGSSAVQGMDPERIAPFLALVREQYQVYQRFLVAGSDGRTVYDSAGAESGSCRDEPWFRQALEGRRSMSGVRMAAGGAESVFDLAAPLPGPDGRLRGAVCATVSTAAILRGVLSVSLGETGESYLVDKTGTFLAHKDPGRILKDNIAQSESFANIFREKGLRTVYRDYRGIMVLGTSRSIQDTPWYLVVEQDEDEAFASAQRLRASIHVAIALTIAGAIGLSVLLAYYVTAPVRALHESALALGRGDFASAVGHLPAGRRDEIGTLRDAFEQMAFQLRDRHSSLADRVGATERELQKADVRLKNTIEAAARLDHLASLGRLASGVAHEIRTPLTSLKLYLQSVKDDFTISPEHTEDFEIAMRQVSRIEGTINHFLNFARPQDPVMAVVDFGRMVADALIVARPRANHQGVEIATDIAADLPRVEGDVHQLGEVLVNLMVNSLEEMPQGGRLEIAIRPDRSGAQDHPVPCVRIDVRDNGPGIQVEARELLFEPFFTTKASGSGLGLAIVHNIVQRHGGIIRVRTELGAGTTFSIFLPAAGAGT